MSVQNLMQRKVVCAALGGAIVVLVAGCATSHGPSVAERTQAPANAAQIEVINQRALFEKFWKEARRKPFPQQVAAYRRIFLQGENGAFVRKITYVYLKAHDSQSFDEALTDDLRKLLPLYEKHYDEIAALFARFDSMVKSQLAKFYKTFPDAQRLFSANPIRIYAVPSLGKFGGRVLQTDLFGKGEQRGGAPLSIIAFGIDKMILKDLHPDSFFPHEFFHAYHSLAAPHLEKDGKAAPYVGAIWSEGLATLVSSAIEPQLSPRQVLGTAPLAERCEGDYRRYAYEYLRDAAKLTEANWKVRDGDYYFSKWFLVSRKPELDYDDVPMASAYCLGWWICKELHRLHTLDAMAHWKFAEVRQQVVPVLHKFAADYRTAEKIRLPVADLDPKALIRLKQRATSSKSDAFIIWHDGEVVEEFGGGDKGRPLDVQSITKSVVALAIARLVDMGKASWDSPLADWIHEWRGTPKAEITLSQVMSHTSGLYAASPQQTFASKDLVGFAIGSKLVNHPGEEHRYNGNAVNLLPHIIQQATGKSIVALLQSELFAAMGIEMGPWQQDPKGNYDASGGLRLKAVDLFKIGRLMLNLGRWANRQLLARATVERVLSPASKTNRRQGLLWSLVPHEGDERSAFYAHGWKGQVIAVVPHERLIVVRQANVMVSDPSSLDGMDDLQALVPALVGRPPFAVRAN